MSYDPEILLELADLQRKAAKEQGVRLSVITDRCVCRHSRGSHDNSGMGECMWPQCQCKRFKIS